MANPRYLDLIDEWGKALLTIAGAFAIFAGVGRWMRKRWEKNVELVVRTALKVEIEQVTGLGLNTQSCLSKIERLTGIIEEDRQEYLAVFRKHVELAEENREWLIDLQAVWDAEHMAKLGVTQDRRMTGNERRQRTGDMLEDLERRQQGRRISDHARERGSRGETT